jgi:O-antigen/teichoic acid export membrane protein
MLNRIKGWLLRQRNATRLTFLLQIVCRVLTSAFSLLWTPLLLASMGKALNGVFLSFQSICTLGGLGDLGMGGMVNIHASRMLGQGKEDELKTFLSAARAFFALVALLAALVFAVIAPRLFQVEKFEAVSSVGPFLPLAIVGAIAIGFVILNSYITNLNYGCGNIFWPILPGFILMQLGLLGHWLLARQNAPLWVQYLPYVASALLVHLTGWIWIRLSHPTLATLLPLGLDWRQFASMVGKSFWVYLYCLSSGVYVAVSGLLIPPAFGPEALTVYRFNNRLCELAMFVITSASLASLPKITQWFASANPESRERATREAKRLNKFQTLLGCSAALVYLALNDLFIRYWLGKGIQADFSLQCAFALNLAVTAAGLVGFDLAARCCEHGLRVGGIAVAFTALLNLGLSLLAMKQRSLLGMALATVISQSAVTLALGWFTSRQTALSWWQLSMRNWLLAVAAVGVGVAVRAYFPVHSVGSGLLAGGASLLTILAVAFLVGIRVSDIQEEARIFSGLLRKK